MNENKKCRNKPSDKLLFLIDLDGTILIDSTKCNIHTIAKQAIKRAVKEGHIVCIVTGRPWRSTKSIYEELDLKTAVSNHNGGHIHHPKDEEFISIIKYIDLNQLMYILGNEHLKKSWKNFAIQGINWAQINKQDPILESIFGLNKAEKFQVGMDLWKLPLKPVGAFIDLKEGVDVIELGDYLRRRYCDLAEFSSWPKGAGQTFVFEIAPLESKKSVAVSFLARYYHIENRNVVAIGDGINDIPMLEVAGISVAMKNADSNVQQKAMYVTDVTNEEGGAGVIINKILDKYNKNKNFHCENGKPIKKRTKILE